MNGLKGRTEPRLFTPPLRRLTPKTSLGFEAIEFARDVCGVTLYPWQEWLLKHALELHPDGGFRFRTIVVLVARQQGKSMLSVILSLYFMYVLQRDLVIGTAQDLDVAEEIWQEAVDLIEETPDLDALKERVVKVNGKKTVELKSGERYKVKAANRRAGRGLSGELILLDELREHQNFEAWGAISKTTIARPDAQVWALSNAGDASSVVLRFLRQKAHEALGDPDGLVENAGGADLATEEVEEDTDESTLGLFEWSAPPDAGVKDRDAWTYANPALGYGFVTERTLASAADTDPEWVFRTECLCQWSDGALDGPFPPGSWEAGKVNEAEAAANPIVGTPVACVEVSWDRSRASIVYAGHREDGLPQAETVFYRYDPDKAVDWLTSPDRSVRPSMIVLRKSGPGASLAQRFEDAGFEVTWWAGGDISQGCGDLYDAVRGAEGEACGPLRHAAHTTLDVAAATAASTPFGDRWSWDMKKSPTDISPLVALTGAVWALNRPEPPRSAYADHDLIII